MFPQSPTAKPIGVVIAAVILFGTPDSTGRYSALLRSIDLSVEKAQSGPDMPAMDIDGKDIIPESYDIDRLLVMYISEKRYLLFDRFNLHSLLLPITEAGTALSGISSWLRNETKIPVTAFGP